MIIVPQPEKLTIFQFAERNNTQIVLQIVHLLDLILVYMMWIYW